MKREYNIAGFGGQGILFLGQVLAYAGMLAGMESTWIPSYGPEMRGGTANCMVVVSDRKVRSPLVYSPDVAIIFNKPSLEKYGPEIRQGGTALLVSDLIDNSTPRGDIRVCRVPAKSLAKKIGAPMSLNMVMLGALLRVDPVVSYSHVEEAVGRITPPARRHLCEVNLRAVRCGMEYTG